MSIGKSIQQAQCIFSDGARSNALSADATQELHRCSTLGVTFMKKAFGLRMARRVRDGGI
jgi:hypothetical protein